MVVSSGVIRAPNLIVAENLNMNLDASEIWGDYAIPDPFSDYFKTIFKDHNPVAVVPAKLRPTWKNGRGVL